jgi:hypothetical protein
LTAAEQSQWYVDAGLGGPAYEFDWFVFGCSDAIIANSRQVAGDVVLNEVAYRDIEGASGFPSLSDTQYTSWLGESVESRFSAYDSPPDARLTTNVQTSLASTIDSSPYGIPGLLAASYLDFSCPAGLSLFIGEILKGPGQTAAVAKNLQIESVMSVNVQGTEVTVAMAGTYVGVTGRAYAGTNAALWGVTYINSTPSGSPTTTSTTPTPTKLASTGAEVELFALGSPIAVVAGLAFLALCRRKRTEVSIRVKAVTN